MINVQVKSSQFPFFALDIDHSLFLVKCFFIAKTRKDDMSRMVAIVVMLLPTANLCAAELNDDRITVTYELTDLLYKPGSTKSGYDSLDEVIKTIVTTVNPKSWLLSPEGGNRFFEVNGKKLEIRATKKDHDEIKELIHSLRRLNDLTVDVKATFLAVDAKWFAKEIAPLLQKKKKRIDDNEEACPKENAAFAALYKKVETIQTGATRQGNGRAGTIASLRQAHTFATGMVEANGEPVWGVEYSGISYRAKTTMSTDRRFITLKIQEIWREIDAPGKGNAISRIKEKKTESEITLADGDSHLHIVPYTPKTIAERGQILLLRIVPELYIEAEEKERRGKKNDG